MIKMRKYFFVVVFLTLSVLGTNAQCGIENKAFKSGEFLYYDLYLNWKII